MRPGASQYKRSSLPVACCLFRDYAINNALSSLGVLWLLRGWDSGPHYDSVLLWLLFCSIRYLDSLCAGSFSGDTKRRLVLVRGGFVSRCGKNVKIHPEIMARACVEISSNIEV